MQSRRRQIRKQPLKLPESFGRLERLPRRAYGIERARSLNKPIRTPILALRIHMPGGAVAR